MPVCFAVAAILSAILFTQSTDAPLTRHVSGQLLISDSDPAIQITFSPGFKYVGGRRFNLYRVAEAEQHFFVQAGAHGRIERFYWLQFEHYLPDNPTRTTTRSSPARATSTAISSSMTAPFFPTTRPNSASLIPTAPKPWPYSQKPACGFLLPWRVSACS